MYKGSLYNKDINHFMPVIYITNIFMHLALYFTMGRLLIEVDKICQSAVHLVFIFLSMVCLVDIYRNGKKRYFGGLTVGLQNFM